MNIDDIVRIVYDDDDVYTYFLDDSYYVLTDGNVLYAFKGNDDVWSFSIVNNSMYSQIQNFIEAHPELNSDSLLVKSATHR
jgi:hypothetical protein